MRDWGLYACYRMRNWSQPLAGRSKRIDTKVSILLGLQFPLFLSLTHAGERRPLRKGVRQRIFLFRRSAHCAPISLPLRSVRYITAAHIGYSPQAQHRVNCPKGRRSHTGVPRRATHLHIASPQGQFFIFYSQLLLRIRKKAPLSRCFQLVEKAIFDFYASCGSTHSIEFALQIHKFREHVSRNLYKERKNVSAGRGFSSRFD